MTADLIEVGAIKADLPLVIVREALRSGEVRLSAQAQSMTALETRATAILAWAIAIGVALVAAAAQGRVVPVALASGGFLFLAALACVGALWPRVWHPPGYSVNDMRGWAASSEFQLIEAIADGYAAAIASNDKRAACFALFLRAAWGCFLAAPIAGAGAIAWINGGWVAVP